MIEIKIKPQIGHTLGLELCNFSIKGAQSFTHLFNAMSGLTTETVLLLQHCQT